MNADQLPLHETVVVSQDDVLRATITRASVEMVEMNYYHQPTNNVVLKVRARVDGQWSSLDYFDRAFWNIRIDGRPATTEDLEDIAKRPGSVHVDSNTRTLSLGLPLA